MKIMSSWMSLDELQGARTRRYYIESSGKKEMNQFTYRQTFGIHSRYRHQVYDHNNQIHAPFSLDWTWETKFWPDRNFPWYLAVSEVNTDIASSYFQNDGVLQLSLDFGYIWQQIALRIHLGLNWVRMDNLRELQKYLFVPLVRKLQ